MGLIEGKQHIVHAGPAKGPHSLDKAIDVLAQRAAKKAAGKVDEAKRQFEAIEAGKDALVLFLMATVVSFASSWSQVAAILVWRSTDAYFIVACGFLAFSFLAGCLYIRFRGWRDIVRMISTLVAIMLHSVIEVFEEVQDPSEEPNRKVQELKGVSGQVSECLDGDDRLASDAADTCFDVQWVCILSSLVFYVIWLALK